MVTQEDIEKASKVINQLLYAKGYFTDDTSISEDDSTSQQKLLYSSIDATELETVKNGVIENDKLNINIIYQLISDVDQAREDIKVKNEQLKEKDYALQRKDKTIEELRTKINLKDTHLKESNQVEITTNERYKQIADENRELQRELHDIKALNMAITSRKDIEIRRLQIEIESLQDTIQTIHKRQKRISNLTITNNGITVPGSRGNPISTNPNDTLVNTELFDAETSKLIESLTQLTKSSLDINRSLTKQLETTKVYLNMLLTEKTPPTPKFFFDNYQPANSEFKSISSDLRFEVNTCSEINTNIERELQEVLTKIHRQLQDQEFSVIFGRASRLNDDGNTSNNTDAKNKEIDGLRKQVEKLTENLNSLYEVNEKLKSRLSTRHKSESKTESIPK